MDRIAPFVVGLGMCVVVVRALVTGSAAADGQGLTREYLPYVFWSVVALAAASALFLFYLAWRG